MRRRGVVGGRLEVASKGKGGRKVKANDQAKEQAIAGSGGEVEGEEGNGLKKGWKCVEKLDGRCQEVHRGIGCWNNGPKRRRKAKVS